jgi:serine/threonine protein phosphatase PrpC
MILTFPFTRKRPYAHHVSEFSNISHAGYLLKRSNRPYQTVNPFPRDDEEVNFKYGGPRLKPILSSRIELSAIDTIETIQPPRQFLLIPHEENTDPDQHLPDNKTNEIENRNVSTTSQHDALDQTLQFAASFFGIPFDLLPKSQQKDVDYDNDELTGPFGDPSSPPLTRSIPIRRNNPEPDTERPSPFRFSFSSSQSEELKHLEHRSLSDCSQPGDFVEDDGHIWRARYCILEDGVLYFYRHQQDAESPEARLERQQKKGADDVGASKQLPLGYSPIPTIYAKDRDDGSHLWEKRVALNCVGAVRSAEFEYGKNSFELTAVDDEGEENDTKLVLRAQSKEEMNQWMFQFHCSIQTYIMGIMDHVAPSLGDIHHPYLSILKTAGRNDAKGDESSPKRYSSSASVTLSPHSRCSTGVGSLPPLSHGHGRNSMHRRRARDKESEQVNIASSVPNTPLLASILSQHKRSLGEEPNLTQTSRRVTPSPVTASPLPARIPLESSSPELSAPQTACPETEHPVPSKQYVPPHLRNQQESNKYVPPHLRNRDQAVPPHIRDETRRTQSNNDYVPRNLRKTPVDAEHPSISFSLENRTARLSISVSDGEAKESDFGFESAVREGTEGIPYNILRDFKLGGCADPSVISGSILDGEFIPRKASRLGKVHTAPYGCTSKTSTYSSPTAPGLRWEIGAVSECGVRDSNEDSFLIVSDVLEAFKVLSSTEETIWDEFGDHIPGLFAIFDGHCGNHAARYSAEKLMEHIHKKSIRVSAQDASQLSEVISAIIEQAIFCLDDDFCNTCVQDGREWDSGATAVIAAVINQNLVVANLGDARGVMSRSVDSNEKAKDLYQEGWNEIPIPDQLCSRRCFWKDVTDTHSPDRNDERLRIQQANGWVTTEQEIPISQLKRLVLEDQDVVDILKRCFADRFQPSPRAAAPQRIIRISRVCGELAISRAIGDRDFKARYNNTCEDNQAWDGSMFLPYPDDHNRCFVGDLVSNQPEFQSFRLGEDGIHDEFLLLACDGLWDVIDSDDVSTEC